MSGSTTARTVSVLGKQSVAENKLRVVRPRSTFSVSLERGFSALALFTFGAGSLCACVCRAWIQQHHSPQLAGLQEQPSPVMTAKNVCRHRPVSPGGDSRCGFGRVDESSQSARDQALLSMLSLSLMLTSS